MLLGDLMEQKQTVKYVNKKEQFRILYIMPTLLIIGAFFYANPLQLWNGLVNGFIWNNRLVSDSFVVMGIGSSLLNAGLLGVISTLLIMKLDLKPNGIILVGYFLMMGFGFIGKNLINIIPIFIGGYLYSLFKGVPFKASVVMSMLATAISPLISSLAFIHPNPFIGVAIATVIGIMFGFILPAVSTHVILSHHGYSLYNMGFAAGLTAMVFYGILKSNHIVFEGNMLVYEAIPIPVFILLAIGFSSFILIGYFENKRSLSGLSRIYSQSGKLVSDYTRIAGFPISLINMGVLGLFSLVVCILMQQLNGAILCGLFSVVGFGAFGKHLRNTIPIMIGVYLASLVLPNNIHPSLIVMTMFLATSLAPVAGEYGIIWGILTGILHMFFVWNLSSLHGGVNLYNNGLSAGLLAMVIVPIIQLLKGELE